MGAMCRCVKWADIVLYVLSFTSFSFVLHSEGRIPGSYGVSGVLIRLLSHTHSLFVYYFDYHLLIKGMSILIVREFLHFTEL